MSNIYATDYAYAMDYDDEIYKLKFLQSYNLIKKSLKLYVPKNDLYEIYLNFYHHISRM